MIVIKRIVKVIVLIAGVVLISYISATPGDQIVAAAIGGACIGTIAGLILVGE